MPAFEVRAISVSGQMHWIEITPTAGGDIIYIIAREVTQQKFAQAQLMRNQRLFQIAGETALIGGWYVDTTDGLPIWSDELSNIHGMPAGFRPSSEEAFSFYAPDSRERLLAAFNACFKRGISFDDEYEIITPQGKRLWVRAIGKAVRDAEGKIIQVQGASQDITEQKQLRENLSKLAKRLTTTLDSITDGFFTLDTHWRFTYVNSEAERILKCRKGELLGQHIWESFPDAKGSRFDEEYQRAARQQKAVHFEDFNPRLGLWVEVHVYPSTEGLTVYFRDVSEHKASEHQLTLLERSVESSTNGVIIVDAQSRDLPMV